MNGSVIAALVAAALIVAYLVWKKRVEQKKLGESKSAPPPEAMVIPSAETVEPAVAREEEPMPVTADLVDVPAAEEIAVVEAMEVIEAVEAPVEPLASQPLTVATDELELVDLDSTPILAEQEEDLEMAEPEPVAAETEPAEDLVVVAEVAEDVSTEPPPVPAAAVVSEIPEEIAALETTEAAEVETIVAEPAEEAVAASEPAAAEQPKTTAEMDELADFLTASVAAESVLPVVRLTLETYSDRLQGLEERQRALLAQAIAAGRDDGLRDRLQRELVIMNDKLALIADSYVEEVACYQQVLETLEQLRGETDEQSALVTAIDRLRNGETEAAETFLAELSGQPHPFAARAAFCSGRLAESRVDLQQALALFRQAVAREPDNPAYLQAAGRAARSLYNYKEALPWLEAFVRLTRQHGDSEPLALALAQRELAYTYVLSGQYQKAGPLYKEAMTALARKLGQDHPEMAISWQQIGELQETLGEYDKAVGLYKKALEILEKKRGPEHPVLAGILAKLAALCMELEMEPQAVPLYERLVRIREKALRPTHPQLAISLNSLAESYRLQGRYADAETCYRRILAINEATHGPDHPSVAAVLQELAKLATSQRKPEEAKQYQDRAAAIFQKSVEASERKSEALTLEL